MGFGWVFALFIICGAAFPQLVASPGRLRVFQVPPASESHDVDDIHLLVFLSQALSGLQY